MRIDILAEFYDKFYFTFSIVGKNPINGNPIRTGRELGTPARFDVAYSGEEVAKHVLERRTLHASTLGVVEKVLAEYILDVRIGADDLGYTHCVLDRVVIEHDFDDICRYRDIVRKWIWTWERELDLKPTIVFSGNRSFHLHFLFDRAIILRDEKFTSIAESFIFMLAHVLPDGERRLFLKYDRHVLAQRALHRVPYSINEKTGRRATIVDTNLRPVDPRRAIELMHYNKFPQVLEKVTRTDVATLQVVLSSYLDKACTASGRVKLRSASGNSRSCRKRHYKCGDLSKYSFIERILQVSGLEDGRKRIIYYWLSKWFGCILEIPPEECARAIEEWLSRQGSGDSKVYRSWILKECEYAYRDKICPWTLETTARKDPEIIEILKKHNII